MLICAGTPAMLAIYLRVFQRLRPSYQSRYAWTGGGWLREYFWLDVSITMHGHKGCFQLFGQILTHLKITVQIVCKLFGIANQVELNGLVIPKRIPFG